MAIESQNGDYNLYASAATVFNKTATVDGEYELELRIGDGSKNLHTDAGTLTLTVTAGGLTLFGGSESASKAAGVLRTLLRTGRIFVAAGETMAATLQSANSNDTDVDVTVTPRVVWADVRQLNGKLTDGTPAEIDRPEFYLKKLSARNPDNAATAWEAIHTGPGYGYGAVLQSLNGAGVLYEGSHGLRTRGGLASFYIDGLENSDGIKILTTGTGKDIALAGSGTIVNSNGISVILVDCAAAIDQAVTSPTADSLGARAKTSADNTTSLLGRLGAWTGTGVNTVLGAFQALLSKVAPAPSNIGGTFTPATDSVEAIQEYVAGSRNASNYTGAFSAGVLANASASYVVQSLTVGEAPAVELVAYQYAALGPFTIVVENSQQNDSHILLVYDPASPSSVLWSLTTASGEITVSGDDYKTLLVTDTDAHTGVAGVYGYVLRNTTDDTVVCEGSLTIKERPNVPA